VELSKRQAVAGHIPELDGLRAVAIGLVLSLHLSGMGPGWIGVDLFFFLPGLLITGICIDHPRQFRTFYARRALRIFPPYALALFLVLIAGDLSGHVPPAGMGWLATFTTNIAVAEPRHVIPPHTEHFWSLAIEEQFYLVWPLLIAVFPARRVALIAIPTAFAFRVYLVWSGAIVAAQCSTLARMDAFAVGGLLAVMYRSQSLPSLGRASVWRWGLGILAACLSVSWVGDQSSVAMNSWGYSVIAILSGVLIVASISADPSSSLRVALRHPFMQAVGKRSYAMYLFHIHILSMFPRPTSAVGWVGFAVAGCGLTYGVAALSWRAVEAPVLALKARFPYARVELSDPGVVEVPTAVARSLSVVANNEHP
jgi:peptidoglycan/LPS O-acetylase OafA/YrhL